MALTKYKIVPEESFGLEAIVIKGRRIPVDKLTDEHGDILYKEKSQYIALVDTAPEKIVKDQTK